MCTHKNDTSPIIQHSWAPGILWWLRQWRVCLRCGRYAQRIPELGRSPSFSKSTPGFLPGKSHGQRNLAGEVHRITESQTWLSNSLSLSPEHQAWYSARAIFLWRWQSWKDLWVSSKLVIISEMKRLMKSGWDGLPGVTDLVLGVTKFGAFVFWLPVLMLH